MVVLVLVLVLVVLLVLVLVLGRPAGSASQVVVVVPAGRPAEPAPDNLCSLAAAALPAGLPSLPRRRRLKVPGPYGAGSAG